MTSRKRDRHRANTTPTSTPRLRARPWTRCQTSSSTINQWTLPWSQARWGCLQCSSLPQPLSSGRPCKNPAVKLAVEGMKITATTTSAAAQPSNPLNVTPEFIRLPKPGTLCRWTGLSRSKLNELILPSPVNSFKPPVRSLSLRNRGQIKAVVNAG